MRNNNNNNNNNEGRTGSSAQNENPSAMELAKKIAVCEAARMQGYLSCQAVLEQSGKDAWLECVNPVSEQFSVCVSQR